MGAVSFYLKKAEPDATRQLIYLQYKYNGYKLVFSFGQKIEAKKWNYDKQRVKSNNQTTEDGKYALNDLLNELEKVCEKAYNTALKNGIPQPSVIKQALFEFINQNEEKEDIPSLFKLIERFISGEIQGRGETKAKAKGTLSRYKVAKKHLKDFELKKRYPVNFDTINKDFFNKYVSYLRELELSQNYIAKQLDHVKTFMNEALELGYTNNVAHKSKKFSLKTVDTDAVYLSNDEILKIYKADMKANKRLEQVRDLFVFGCYVGLRFSDYSDIKPENITTVDGQPFIKMKTKKTGELVIIPCNPIILQIFDKYADSPNRLPKSLSNQKFNEYIKEVCKEAELKEKGRLVAEPDKMLYECISSHTARRSFATNLYLEGFPTFELMKITGHKSEKSFRSYIKVSKLDAAKRLNEHNKKMWSMKLLKVA